MSTQHEPAIVEGTYSAFPRSAWLVLALGALMLAAAMKFVVVDRSLQPLPYLLVFAGACGTYALVRWLMVGRFRLADGVLSGERRIGMGFRVHMTSVATIEASGRHKNDTRGVTIRFRGTSGTQTLIRVRPESAIRALVAASEDALQRAASAPRSAR